MEETESLIRLCPECEATLQHKSYKVFHAWQCPEGHGTLYAKGELEEIMTAVSGIADLELRLWNDKDRFSVVQSPLMSPDGPRPLLEIRDQDYMHIMVYGDPVTHSIWVHTGEEEKIACHLEQAAQQDSVASYLSLAAREAAKVLDDDESIRDAAGHFVLSLKLLSERVLRSLPFIAF